MFERIKNYLPSRHLIKMASFCALGLVVVFVGQKLITRAENRKLAASQAQQQSSDYTGKLISISDLTEKDTDSDGVPDWEEALWGTDPNKADTDGNGTSDKAEIDQKKATLAKKNPDVTSDASLTETESFSHELFASIAALKESGNLNDQSIQDLAQTISQNAGDKQIIADSYTTDDVKVSADTNQALAAYQKAIVAVLHKYDGSGIGTELAIIDDSLSKDDKDKLGDLYAISKAYRNLAKDILATAVPPGIAASHLALANSANNIGIALSNTTEIYDNAIGGLIAISQYQAQSDAFTKALSEIQDYLRKNGII